MIILNMSTCLQIFLAKYFPINSYQNRSDKKPAHGYIRPYKSFPPFCRTNTDRKKATIPTNKSDDNRYRPVGWMAIVRAINVPPEANAAR